MKRSVADMIEDGHGRLIRGKKRHEKSPSHYGYIRIDGILYRLAGFSKNNSISLLANEFDEEYIEDD